MFKTSEPGRERIRGIGMEKRLYGRAEWGRNECEMWLERQPGARSSRILLRNLVFIPRATGSFEEF